MGEVNVERFEVVRPRIDGLITEVLVRTGEEFRAGQVLLELDDRNMEEEIASLTSEAAETRAALEGARLRREILTGSIHPREAENQRNALALKSLQTQRQAARVEELKTGAEAAQGRFERMQALDKDGLISRETLEQARLGDAPGQMAAAPEQAEENERRRSSIPAGTNAPFWRPVNSTLWRRLEQPSWNLSSARLASRPGSKS